MSHSNVFTKLAVCAAASGALLAALPTTSFAGKTCIRVPRQADAGEIITIRGSGWAWGEAGDVYWVDGDVQLVDFVTDERGRFEAEIAVPDVEPGRYEVAAIGESTDTVIDTITVRAR
jgi:hypothetical protein